MGDFTRISVIGMTIDAIVLGFFMSVAIILIKLSKKA